MMNGAVVYVLGYLCLLSAGSGQGVCGFCHFAQPGSQKDGEERFHVHTDGGR